MACMKKDIAAKKNLSLPLSLFPSPPPSPNTHTTYSNLSFFNQLLNVIDNHHLTLPSCVILFNLAVNRAALSITSVSAVHQRLKVFQQ